MKKILFFAMLVSLAFASCKKTDENKPDDTTVTPVEHPVFGVITFATDSTWTVTNGTITQTWSDAVTATKCQKATYYAYDTVAKVYLADCRSNPDYKGDLFSWVAVSQYKNDLCPDGWRVPTKQDFIDLDIALGGTGNDQSGATSQVNKYLNIWGGSYGGCCRSDGSLNGQGSGAGYWSQSEYSSTYGYYLVFNLSSYINPQYSYYKYTGFTLRCVR